MNDDKFDKHLREIYSLPVCPPEELVQRTKSSIKRPGILEYTVVSSIVLNLLTIFAFIYVMTFGLHNILARIALFITASAICNALVLLIFIYREKVRELFAKLDTYEI